MSTDALHTFAVTRPDIGPRHYGRFCRTSCRACTRVCAMRPLLGLTRRILCDGHIVCRRYVQYRHGVFAPQVLPTNAKRKSASDEYSEVDSAVLCKNAHCEARPEFCRPVNVLIRSPCSPSWADNILILLYGTGVLRCLHRTAQPLRC